MSAHSSSIPRGPSQDVQLHYAAITFDKLELGILAANRAEAESLHKAQEQLRGVVRFALYFVEVEGPTVSRLRGRRKPCYRITNGTTTVDIFTHALAPTGHNPERPVVTIKITNTRGMQSWRNRVNSDGIRLAAGRKYDCCNHETYVRQVVSALEFLGINVQPWSIERDFDTTNAELGEQMINTWLPGRIDFEQTFHWVGSSARRIGPAPIGWQTLVRLRPKARDDPRSIEERPRGGWSQAQAYRSDIYFFGQRVILYRLETTLYRDALRALMSKKRLKSTSEVLQWIAVHPEKLFRFKELRLASTRYGEVCRLYRDYPEAEALALESLPVIYQVHLLMGQLDGITLTEITSRYLRDAQWPRNLSYVDEIYSPAECDWCGGPITTLRRNRRIEKLHCEEYVEHWPTPLHRSAMDDPSVI